MTSEDQPSARVPVLDGLRGIALLLVFGLHYGFSLVDFGASANSAHVAVLKLGWTGVDLFFVLSGFLIGGVLIDRKSAGNYFKVFYVRRACRILPLYGCWLAVFCGLVAVAPGLPAALAWLIGDPLPLWSYATFIQNVMMAYQNTFGPHWMAVTWSLAVEEQFYLTLPLLIRLVKDRYLPWLLAGIVVAAPLLRVAISVAAPNGPLAAYVLMPCRADALFAGVFCAWMVRQPGLFAGLQKRLPVLYVVLGLFLAGAVVVAIRFDPLFASGWRSLGYTGFALLFSTVLLIAVTEKRGIVSAIANNPLLRAIGIISYGAYLFHQGLLGLAHGLLLDQAPRIRGLADLMVTGFALALTFALAALSWRFFEKPIVAAGHDLRYRAGVAELATGKR